MLSNMHSPPLFTKTRLPRQIPIEASQHLQSSLRESDTGKTQHRHSMTPIDLQEMDDSYVVYVYTDACPQEKLTVTVKDGMLYIRHADGAPVYGNWQNWTGSFSFGFLLPVNANGEVVHAYRQHGLLKIVIGKCQSN